MLVSSQGAGLDTARLELISDRLQRDYVDPGKIAGCQVTVARHGHVAYFRNFGLMDLERGKPTADDTIYRIYSMAKPITAVALMTLHERGDFQLTDPVSRFFPEWKDQRVWLATEGDTVITEPVKRPVMIVDLLRHTAGLTYGEADHPVDDIYRSMGIRDLGNPDSSEVFMQKLGRAPLIYQPGEKWGYGIATDACGALVEHFSGMRFGDYLQEAVCGPLGMTDTSFSIAPEKVPRFAACYRPGPDGSLVLTDDPAASEFADTERFQSGGGGLVSTSADYLKFCEMLRQRGSLGGARILGSRTVELMGYNHLPRGQDLSQMARGMFRDVSGEGLGHGLGFAVRIRDLPAGRLGNGDMLWGGAASTLFWIDPREQLIVILMAQLMPSHTYNLGGLVRSIVMSSIVD